MLQVAECNVLESEHPKIDRAQLSECLAGCRRPRHHAQYVCTYRLPLLGCCSVGPAAAAFQPGDLQAVVDASLVQLFGVIGGALPYVFEAGGSAATGVVTVDKRCAAC